jgi:hypothetical protein
MCESGISVGGYLQIYQDTRINLIITRSHKDLIEKVSRPSFFGSWRTGTNRGS